MNRTRIYEFGDFRLDANARQLYSLRSSEAVPLTPKAVQLLITLVCSNGRLLTKEELLDRVWGGSNVEEGNLSQTIFVLRKTLGEDKSQPRYIITTPSRGYQFIAAVNEADDKNLRADRFQRFGTGGAVNTDAYKAYIEGRSFWNKRTGESLKQAVKRFEEALRQDPDFALAYAGLADSHQLLAEYYAAAVPDRLKQNGNGTKATPEKNDAQLAEAHATLAYAQAFYDWDWAGADRSFKKSLELDPDHATTHQWYADHLCVTGQFDKALKHFKRAIDLAPDSASIAVGLAGYYYTKRDPARLIAQSKNVIGLDPGSAYGYFYLGFGYEFNGMESEAVDAFAMAATLFGEPAEIGEELREAYRQNGMSGVWHKRLDQYETRPHLKNYPRYLKSLVPIRLGDKETSLSWLEQAYEQRDRGIVYAKYEPLLEPLRGDARFKDLVKKIGY